MDVYQSGGLGVSTGTDLAASVLVGNTKHIKKLFTYTWFVISCPDGYQMLINDRFHFL
jgi:hypothetical protein